MSRPAKHFYEFGAFQLDVRERVLRRDGQPVQLTPKAFDTLLVLVEHSGHVVAKGEMIERIWPDSFVEEGNLAFNISVLRKTLAGGSRGAQFIGTVPKRGYRFTARVREFDDEDADVVIEKQTTARIVIEEGGEERQPESAKAFASPDAAPAVRFAERLRRPRVRLAIAALAVGLVAVATFWLTRAPD